MRKPESLTYCTQAVRDHARDCFLLCLFAPADHREALLTIYALDVEMVHVRRAVTEEMLGHIRYAWWQEGLEAIAAGQPPREHPVLQAAHAMGLVPLLLPLAETYRAHYPALPPAGPADDLALSLLRERCPQAEEGWKKAHAVIQRHRQKFGPGWNGWLSFKLLMAGL